MDVERFEERVEARDEFSHVCVLPHGFTKSNSFLLCQAFVLLSL